MNDLTNLVKLGRIETLIVFFIHLTIINNYNIVLYINNINNINNIIIYNYIINNKFYRSLICIKSAIIYHAERDIKPESSSAIPPLSVISDFGIFRDRQNSLPKLTYRFSAFVSSMPENPDRLQSDLFADFRAWLGIDSSSSLVPRASRGRSTSGLRKLVSVLKYALGYAVFFSDSARFEFRVSRQIANYVFISNQH